MAKQKIVIGPLTPSSQALPSKRPIWWVDGWRLVVCDEFVHSHFHLPHPLGKRIWLTISRRRTKEAVKVKLLNNMDFLTYTTDPDLKENFGRAMYRSLRLRLRDAGMTSGIVYVSIEHEEA